MLVEIGVQNVGKAITLETQDTAEAVNARVDATLKDGQALRLTDDKGRTTIVPASTLAYVIIGSEASHPVGFGAL